MYGNQTVQNVAITMDQALIAQCGGNSVPSQNRGKQMRFRVAEADSLGENIRRPVIEEAAISGIPVGF